MASSLTPRILLESSLLGCLCFAHLAAHPLTFAVPALVSSININYLSAFCLSSSVSSCFPFSTIALLSWSCRSFLSWHHFPFAWISLHFQLICLYISGVSELFVSVVSWENKIRIKMQLYWRREPWKRAQEAKIAGNKTKWKNRQKQQEWKKNEFLRNR